MRRNISIILFLFLSASAYSQQFDYKENAVYIYNFIKYTEWPAQKSNIVIGIIGNTACEAELRNLFLKKKSSDITVTLKNIRSADTKNVDVIIVAAQASAEISTVQKITAGMPVLLITEKEGLSRLGACISLYIDEDDDFKTRYELSLRNCKSRGLSVSKEVQENATLVR